MTLATILPPARTVFFDGNDDPLAGGSVFFYIPPNTTTLKTTWQDANQTIPNTNPVILDANGSALIYGSGQYLQYVYDSLDNLIYSGLTQDVYGLILGANSTFTGNNIFNGTSTFNGAATFTNTVSLGSSATATTQTLGDTSTKVATDAFVANAVAAATVAVAYSSIAGCLITGLTGTSTTAAASITAGQATNSINTAYITSAGYAWSATNGNAINGTDAGGSTLVNSTTYHMFLISGPSGTGTFASASLTPTFPSGYTVSSRRIGSFATSNSGSPVPYISIEGEGGSVINWLNTQTLDISVTNLGTSRVLYPLNVPIGIKVQPYCRATAGLVTSTIIFTSGDETDVAPAAGDVNGGWTAVPGADLSSQASGGLNHYVSGSGILTTSTAGQIGARSSAASTDLYLVTRGFKDFRRS